MFEIVGSRDGWLLIRNGEPAADVTLDAAHAADARQPPISIRIRTSHK